MQKNNSTTSKRTQQMQLSREVQKKLRAEIRRLAKSSNPKVRAFISKMAERHPELQSQ